MEEETNQKRAERAESLIKKYDHSLDNLGEIDETLVSDVLADLMHYCRRNDIDIEETIEMAFLHFHEEVREEEQDKQRGEDFS
jgi:hypothetical protein